MPARATSCSTSGARHVTESLPGATVEVHELDGRTPLLLIDVPPTDASGARDDGDTVLLYGHLDKQPPFTGWREGLGPWEPVQDGDRLYGRGSADDGYSTFPAVAALEAVHAAGGAHRRCVVLIEASEEPRPAGTPRGAGRQAGCCAGDRATRGAATTSGCGSRRRSAGSSISRSRCRC